jgi:uncharacterized protein with HEPN domain
MKDDRLYLIHISECIERIESYAKGIDKQEFIDSTLLQDAIIRNLQILSESTQRLSDEVKEKTEVYPPLAGRRTENRRQKAQYARRDTQYDFLLFIYADSAGG